MDRDGWYKTIKNFSNLTSPSVHNPQFNFFDGHDSNWNANVFDETKDNHIHACLLKAGDSENNQPNDNGPIGCFKECYNKEKTI